MIEKLKYIFAGFLMLAIAGSFVACDDDETAVDEWTADYVYLERPALGVSSLEFNLTHSSLGVAGDTDMEVPLAVRLSGPRSSDVVVKLACRVDGDLPEGALAFREGGTIVIPAGELVARDTLEFDTDWSFVPSQKVTYKVEAEIEAVKPASGELRISSKQKGVSVSVNKATLTDILAGVQPVGSRLDRSGWTVYATDDSSENPEWGSPRTQLTDGNSGTYIWFSKPYLGVKIDMGSVQTVTGMETFSYYGASYSMSSCVVYSSENGEDWTLVTPDGGLAMATAATQYVSFVVPVTARYFIWRMSGSSCLSSEIYVYAE